MHRFSEDMQIISTEVKVFDCEEKIFYGHWNVYRIWEEMGLQLEENRNEMPRLAFERIF